MSAPWTVPPLLGFVIGFVGSIPIAGPVAATVVKLGIENRFSDAAAVAIGAGLMEAAYAGIAFWGFGRIAAFIRSYQTVFRALGAAVLMAVGISFMRSETQQSMADQDARSGMEIDMEMEQQGLAVDVGAGENGRFQSSVMYGMGLNLLNPTFLATYTGALTSLYHHVQGHIVFNATHALFFSLGVCLGVNTWLRILILLLQRYKHRLRASVLTRSIQVIGTLLFCLGLSLANSVLFKDAYRSPDLRSSRTASRILTWVAMSALCLQTL